MNYKTVNKSVNELILKWQTEGCLKSRNKVVEANVALCYHIAKKISHPQDFEDVAQSAVEGLIKACDSYDPEKGEWSSHAYMKANAYAWNYKMADRPVKIGKETQLARIRAGNPVADMVEIDQEAQTRDFSDDLINERFLNSSLSLLSQKQREAIKAVRINGMTERQFADSQGVSHQAISDRIKKGIELMKKSLENRGSKI